MAMQENASASPIAARLKMTAMTGIPKKRYKTNMKRNLPNFPEELFSSRGALWLKSAVWRGASFGAV